MCHHRATRLTVILCLFQCLARAALARPAVSPATNATESGDTGNPPLYCEKTQWYDVCWFFFTNYLLHALSVRSLPGEDAYSSTVFKICCLLVPYTGVRRGLSLISRASSLTRDDLQAAAQAGALCMVVRKKDWRPEAGQVIHGCRIRNVNEEQSSKRVDSSLGVKPNPFDLPEIEKLDSQIDSYDDECPNQCSISLNLRDPYEPPAPSRILDKLSRILVLTDRFFNDTPSSSPVDHESIKIHGLCKLVPGYGLSYISPNVKVYGRHNVELGLQKTKSTRLASSHDVPRILFSLIQTCSGGYSLYQARGSQIDRYGYAAFGLTVLPYMIVSIINFIGSLLSAEYETIYMVHSETMDEMIGRGGVVDGVVGTVHGNPTLDLVPTNPEDAIGERSVSVSFEGDPAHLRGHECGSEKGQTFPILPYEPPKPPSKETRWARCYRQYRLWHGLSAPQDLYSCSKLKAPLPTPTIDVTTHSPVQHLPPPTYQDYLNIFALIILLLTLSLPYVIIAILTGWKANRSTTVEQNFVLAWLICGQVQGYAVAKVERLTGKKNTIRGLILIFLFYGSNCLSGLTIVAEEMVEFGTCKAV